MDDEAKQLLREIRDLLTANGAQDATHNDEMRASIRRGRMAMRVVLVVAVTWFAFVGWVVWSSLNPADDHRRSRSDQSAPHDY